jgi:hypothetical protein
VRILLPWSATTRKSPATPWRRRVRKLSTKCNASFMILLGARVA